MAHDDGGAKPLTIYVSNMSEDVWPFVEAMGSERERLTELEDNINSCDRDLFSLAEREEFVFISPAPVDTDFTEYYQALCGRKRITFLTPARHSGLVCNDVLADPDLFESLCAQARGAREVELISYCFSPQLSRLAAELRARGIQVHTPEAPVPGSEWTVNYFGSKSGVRQLFQQPAAVDRGFRFPAGFIAEDLETAAGLAARFYLDRGGVVIKTNKGHAGAGLFIIRDGELAASYAKAAEAIAARLGEAPYWRKFPIIVEELIAIDYAAGRGSPSIEYRVNADGEIVHLYSCGMRVSHGGVFQGIEIDKQAVPPALDLALLSAGRYAAETYASHGYRGYFDIDFNVGCDGTVYVDESNIRRTGGTHVFHLARHLLGPERMGSACIIAANSCPLPGKRIGLAKARELLASIGYDPAHGTGIVICSELKFRQGQIAFVILGQDRLHALDLEHHLEELLCRA